jgi:hypothetical protein
MVGTVRRAFLFDMPKKYRNSARKQRCAGSAGILPAFGAPERFKFAGRMPALQRYGLGDRDLLRS